MCLSKVETKTVKECIQFYYLWKKICPEEYKRLRIVRRRKEQEGLFYSNPVVTKEEETEDNDVDNKSAVDGDEDALSIDSPMNASPSSVSSTATAGASVVVGGKSKEKSGLFPCRVCGKVFSKVKSRSAHMKVHGAGAAANPAYSSAASSKWSTKIPKFKHSKEKALTTLTYIHIVIYNRLTGWADKFLKINHRKAINCYQQLNWVLSTLLSLQVRND